MDLSTWWSKFSHNLPSETEIRHYCHELQTRMVSRFTSAPHEFPFPPEQNPKHPAVVADQGLSRVVQPGLSTQSVNVDKALSPVVPVCRVNETPWYVSPVVPSQSTISSSSSGAWAVQREPIQPTRADCLRTWEIGTIPSQLFGVHASRDGPTPLETSWSGGNVAGREQATKGPRIGKMQLPTSWSSVPKQSALPSAFNAPSTSSAGHAAPVTPADVSGAEHWRPSKIRETSVSGLGGNRSPVMMACNLSGGTVAGSAGTRTGLTVDSAAWEVTAVPYAGGGMEYSSPWGVVPGQPSLPSFTLVSNSDVTEAIEASTPQLPLELRSSRRSSHSSSPTQWNPILSRVQTPQGSTCPSETSPFQAPPTPEPWPDVQHPLNTPLLMDLMDGLCGGGRAKQFRNRIICPERNPNSIPFAERCERNLWHPHHQQPKHSQELNDEVALL